MVPKWFLGTQFQKESRSTLVLIGTALVLFSGIWILGKESLKMVLDLAAFSNLEGRWIYGAALRERGGLEVVQQLGFYPPHLLLLPLLGGDPLVAVLSLRVAALLGMATVSCLFFLEANFRSVPKSSALILAILFLLWSQNSSNSWNPLVPAVLFFWIGVILQRKKGHGFSVPFFLLASLLDLRMLFGGLIYLSLMTLKEKRSRWSSFYLLLVFLFANVFLGIYFGFSETVSMWRIYIPDLIQQNPINFDTRILGAPLSVFGAWILSFYFWKAKVNYRIAAILAVTSYLLLAVSREGSSFVFGSIFWLPVFLLIGLSVLYFSGNTEEPQNFEWIILTLVLSFCLFPLGNVSNAMAIFPFLLFVLASFLKRISDLYPRIWAFWWYFPMMIFLFGGIAQQTRSVLLINSSKENSWGLKSAGEVDRWLNEATVLKKEMQNSGWNPGDEVEIVPENFALRAFWGYAYPRTGNPAYRITAKAGTFEIPTMSK